MSDPSCAYRSGGTGEMTATSMLGLWSGAWYDPGGVHQSGRAEPRWRARIVNADNCGGQPLTSLPVVGADGTTGYYFVSDRWDNRAPNKSLANFFFGPMSFGRDGTLQDIACVNRFSITATSAGMSCGSKVSCRRVAARSPPRRSPRSSAGTPAAHPDIPVTASHPYLPRLESATTTGCFGWEYNDSGPYPGGAEWYRTDHSGSFTAEPGRDLKFDTAVHPA
jgi:hypothetical protein